MLFPSSAHPEVAGHLFLWNIYTALQTYTTSYAVDYSLNCV